MPGIPILIAAVFAAVGLPDPPEMIVMRVQPPGSDAMLIAVLSEQSGRLKSSDATIELRPVVEGDRIVVTAVTGDSESAARGTVSGEIRGDRVLVTEDGWRITLVSRSPVP